MNMLPVLSIIILNYQGKAVLGRCVNSLLRSSYQNYEVVFVDNASTDGSYEDALALLSDIKYKIIIRNEQNYGFTKGFNIGMKTANGKYLLLLNNDAFVSENALEELVNFMDENPSVGMAEGRIVNKAAGTYTTSNPNVVNFFGQFVEAGTHTLDHAEFETVKYILCPVGVWPIVRREAYELTGGYDEDFVHVEEIRDWAMRIWISGYKVGYIFNAMTEHLGRLTNTANNYGKAIALSTYYNSTKNKILLFLKDFQDRTILLYYFPFILIVLTDLLSSSFYHGKSAFGAKFRAYVWIIKNISNINEKRYRIKKIRTTGDRTILSNAVRLSPTNMKSMITMRKDYEFDTFKWLNNRY